MEDKLKQYKKIYWDIKLSEREVEESWQQLKFKLSPPKSYYFKPVVAFLAVLLIFLTGLVGLTQAAAPGGTLYPVKILADKIVAKVSNKPQLNVERRAQDVIEVSKNQPAKLPEASKQYNKALDETEKEVEKGKGSKDQLSNSLDKQEQWLKEAIKENPHSKIQLKKDLENVHSIKEKLKNNTKKTHGGGD